MYRHVRRIGSALGLGCRPVARAIIPDFAQYSPHHAIRLNLSQTSVPCIFIPLAVQQQVMCLTLKARPGRDSELSSILLETLQLSFFI